MVVSNFNLQFAIHFFFYEKNNLKSVKMCFRIVTCEPTESFHSKSG